VLEASLELREGVEGEDRDEDGDERIVDDELSEIAIDVGAALDVRGGLDSVDKDVDVGEAGEVLLAAGAVKLVETAGSLPSQLATARTRFFQPIPVRPRNQP
jgi:hypothetical protein